MPGISTEQLRSRLNRMVADGLLTRQRYREVPPRVDYELTDRAKDLLPVVGALARWGYQWAWTPPREGEGLDVGAILRSLPGLAVPSGFSGTAEIVVDRGDQGEKRYVVCTEDDAMVVHEQPAESPDATITGTQDAWVSALGPDADRGDLLVSGDQSTASALLDGLAPVAVRDAAVA